MTIAELCSTYRTWVSATQKDEQRDHVLWMLDEIPKMPTADRGKANRWLGFVQGWLWTKGWSIDQMRKDVRSLDSGQL